MACREQREAAAEATPAAVEARTTAQKERRAATAACHHEAIAVVRPWVTGVGCPAATAAARRDPAVAAHHEVRAGAQGEGKKAVPRRC